MHTIETADERLTLTPMQVAKALGLSRDELYKRLTRGELPFPAHRVGKLWMIPREPFLRWLNGEPINAPTAPTTDAS